jgi:four helix bundle protein
MAYKKFEENLSWQKANEAVVEIYRAFQNSKETWFRDELLRSAAESATQIAKGHELPTAAYIECLQNARNGFTHCRSVLYSVQTLKILKDSEVQHLLDKLSDASKLSYGLLKKLKEKTAA